MYHNYIDVMGCGRVVMVWEKIAKDLPIRGALVELHPSW